jgi:hypothetical protein
MNCEVNMEKKKKVRTEFVNVGILDIRRPPKDDLGTIELVNVNHILYSKETGGLLNDSRKLEVVNVGGFIEASQEAIILMSHTSIDNEYFKHQKQPLELIVFGLTTIGPDVTEESLQKGIKQISVVKGPLLCPQRLAETVQSKIKAQEGMVIFYDATNLVASAKRIELDEEFLASMVEGSVVVAAGSLRLPEVLPNGLMSKKIRRLYALDGILCHEENIAELRKLIKDQGKEIRTIPAGFQLIEEPITITNYTLENMKSTKLYCREWVNIEASVDPKLLTQKLEKLVSNEQIICPSALKKILTEKTDWTKSNIIYYEGELWLIDGDRTLQQNALAATKGKATLVVLGQLTIANDVDLSSFNKTVDRIHNFGNLRCLPEHLQTINSKLGMNEGNIEDTSEKHRHEKTHVDDDVISHKYVNVPYIAL